jgi:ribosomal small subunit protein bTHX
MAMTQDDVRRLALALPEAIEAPHFHFTSFRVGTKMFATMPPDATHLHVFVDEPDRERMIALYPASYEKLWWGKKVLGLRVTLGGTRAVDIQQLLRLAWQRKAPKALVALQAVAITPRLASRNSRRSVLESAVGKGDRKTRRGKIYAGSFGKKRPKDVAKKKTVAKKATRK